MRRLAVAATVLLALAAVACGGDGPSTVIVLEADLGSLPTVVDPEVAMRDLAGVVERRASGLGAEGVEVQPEGDRRLRIVLKGITQVGQARSLFAHQGILEVREPAVEGGLIVCRDPMGQFAVDPLQAVEAVGDDGRHVLACEGGGRHGEAEWHGVPPIGVRSAEPQESGGEPGVVVRFTDLGAAAFQQLTARLVGFPLGFFVDGNLATAPRVVAPITGGSVRIQGLTQDEAVVLAAQLNSGPLPVPVAIISAETSQ